MYIPVDSSSVIYSTLKELIPSEGTFFEWYYDGARYNKAFTDYFNSNKELIYRDNHGWKSWTT